MDNTQACCMSEQEKMTDLLASEKCMTANYNTFCCEAATASVKNCLLSLLMDEHRMQEEVFNEMSVRGWYKTETAEEQKVSAAKQKFSQKVTV